ncbi:excalibur calcium-binding domain-containing protein [Streptomyces sp. NPDC126497]|uniref:excalibur calcium-binding domain-containing protein n=1 Tax=Streptomyces sp. NPDC126497 TaxID=3155313 RepID=UPI00331D7177
MHPMRSFTTVLAALALAALPATAVAHDGDHPFTSCSEAYGNGYSGISSGDDHYDPQLDPDGDGVACDEPPADFTPRDHTEIGGDPTPTADTGTTARGDDLAETGNDVTTYLTIGVCAVVLAGGALLLVSRLRRNGG